MKPYQIKVYNKETARALVGIFIEGLVRDAKRTPEENEAIEIMTRLGEWSEDIIDA